MHGYRRLRIADVFPAILWLATKEGFLWLHCCRVQAEASYRFDKTAQVSPILAGSKVSWIEIREKFPEAYFRMSQEMWRSVFHKIGLFSSIGFRHSAVAKEVQHECDSSYQYR